MCGESTSRLWPKLDSSAHNAVVRVVAITTAAAGRGERQRGPLADSAVVRLWAGQCAGRTRNCGMVRGSSDKSAGEGRKRERVGPDGVDPGGWDM